MSHNAFLAILAILIGGGGVGGLSALFVAKSGSRANNANASGQISDAWQKLFQPYRDQIVDLESDVAELKEELKDVANELLAVVEANGAPYRQQIIDLQATIANLTAEIVGLREEIRVLTSR